MIFAIFGSLFLSAANVVGKYISVNFGICKSLFVQYFLTALFWVILFMIFGNIGFEVNSYSISLLLLIGLSGYLWIRSLLKAMINNNAGIVSIIAYLYIFTSYFVNIWLIGWVEKFSITKLILGIIYFIVTSLLIIEKWEDQKIKINKSILLSFVTVISWTAFFCLNNYMIKTKILDPLQMIAYTEIFIFIFSFIAYIWEVLVTKKNVINDLILTKKQSISYFLLAFFTFFWALLYFYGYQFSAGNIVNFVNLSSVIFTALIAWIFLKEKLNKKQMTTMIFAIAILVLFVKF